VTVKLPQGNVEVSDVDRVKCEVWTRVMGYYRPKSQFNRGKKREVSDRVFYKH